MNLTSSFVLLAVTATYSLASRPFSDGNYELGTDARALSDANSGRPLTHPHSHRKTDSAAEIKHSLLPEHRSGRARLHAEEPAEHGVTLRKALADHVELQHPNLNSLENISHENNSLSATMINTLRSSAIGSYSNNSSASTLLLRESQQLDHETSLLQKHAEHNRTAIPKNPEIEKEVTLTMNLPVYIWVLLFIAVGTLIFTIAIMSCRPVDSQTDATNDNRKSPRQNAPLPTPTRLSRMDRSSVDRISQGKERTFKFFVLDEDAHDTPHEKNSWQLHDIWVTPSGEITYAKPDAPEGERPVSVFHSTTIGNLSIDRMSADAACMEWVISVKPIGSEWDDFHALLMAAVDEDTLTAFLEASHGPESAELYTEMRSASIIDTRGL